MSQHEQIGEYTYSINESGAKIEHSLWHPSQLDGGRCCGRKAHEYKTKYGYGSGKDHHFCCFKCDREYTPDGKQRQNWAYQFTSDGNYQRDRPVARTAERVTCE